MKNNQKLRVTLVFIIVIIFTYFIGWNTFVQAKSSKINLKRENIYGFVNDLYEKDEKTMVAIDEVEFFRGDKARKEYSKDNNGEISQDAFGWDYYIRNKDNSEKNYTISPNCKFQVCKFAISNDISIDLVEISLEEFKIYVSKSLEQYKLPTRALLFKITLQDNIITKIVMEYTP